jgi:hypothetical protein
LETKAIVNPEWRGGGAMPQSKFELTIEQATSALWKPAGDSPRFASMTAIRDNHYDFVVACHKTWKHWHQKAVREILFFDGFALAEKTDPMGPQAEEFANYNRAVWRRINDAIVWSIFGGERHVIKRLCLYRPRTFLSESNASEAMGTVAALNSEPLSIAIWNDATSCVDIGDVLFVKDGRVPVPEFIELKGGNVNSEIVEIAQLNGAERESRLQAFREKYGKNGLKQFERVLRQKKIADQALDLLLDERGTDPVTGYPMEVVSLPHVPETYDEHLNRVLLEAIDRHSEVLELIDGCLWLYASADPSCNRHQAAHRFHQQLVSRGVCESATTKRRLPRWDRDRIVPLGATFAQPVAKPLFIRPLDARVIASVTYGALMFKAYLYIDWKRFATVIHDAGARFTWGSDKEMRRARAMPTHVRPPIFGGKLPIVYVGDVKMFITDPAIVQMLFDGIAPRSIAKSLIAHAEHLKQATVRSEGKDTEAGS